MPTLRLETVLNQRLEELGRTGRLKGDESVITGVVPAGDGKGPRYLLKGQGDRPFLRMNSNGYLGLALHVKVKAAEEEAVRRFGTGPGAVRFISGTWEPHVALEQRVAAFHDRPAAMLFSSAYATVMGILPPLITDRTAVISDELNHNSIINAIALGRPAEKRIYRHLDMGELERHLAETARACTRAIIVTDGVFSMRGDHAPLERIRALVDRFDAAFAENALLIVDDSHGVGALGPCGRGAEEVTCAGAADLLGRQWRLRRRQRHAHSVPARGIVLLHLLEPNNASGGCGCPCGGWHRRWPRRPRAACTPLSEDRAVQAWPRQPRIRDSGGRAPGGAADGARHAAHIAHHKTSAR
jgi:glycine C-acetyltransferase